MDCKKALRLYEESAGQRLADANARELNQHFAECSDCRVSRHRAARLQQLLAVKKYETPGPAYFAGFVDDFHRRLDAESAHAAGNWRRFLPDFGSKSIAVWACGLAAAATAAVVATAIWHHTAAESAAPAAPPVELTAKVEPPVLPAQAPMPSQSTPTTVIAASLPPVPAGIHAEEAAIVPAGGVVVMPAAAGSATPPRYVLDRLNVTPVSYEVGSIRF